MSNKCKESAGAFGLEGALNACSSSECGFTAQGLQCNGTRCINNTLKSGRRALSLQRVPDDEHSVAFSSGQQDPSPQVEDERIGDRLEMVQICYRSPVVDLVLQREDEVQADSSRARRGFSMIADLEASEPRRRYMCLSSQFQPETKVFDARRLSGRTFAEPHGHLASLETKVKRVMNKAKQRLHLVSEASIPGGKTQHTRYSDEQVKEANKRSARLSLKREAVSVDAQLAKEEKDTKKRLARLDEANEADIKLAKARAEQDRTTKG